ncbi:MAG: Nucleoporin 62kDa-like protein [Actinomycetia bacterium]|nr:Nucleoporin 62kDa-like protein [Actinomycetes bacterium]
MRKRSLFTAIATGALLLGVTTPAAAGPSTANITVLGGVLSISVQPAAGSLGTRPNSVTGGTISGSLGQVQVNDARSAAAGSGWVATAISTAFTPGTGPAIAASAVGYAAGAITKVGTATFTANDPSDLTAVSPVVTATGITGDNSATWNPTITIAVPGGALAGTYYATITHSVV